MNKHFNPITTPPDRFRASVLSDPKDIASSPIRRFLYRFSVPLRWYRGTIAHILFLEIRTLWKRISAIRQDPSLPLDFVPLPRDPRPNHSVIPIADACSDGIERLRRSTGGMFPIGMRLYSQGFSEGASWMLRNCNPEKPEFPSAESITPVVSQ
jgi:hypothetical protein